jgi:putative endonuclease
MRKRFWVYIMSSNSGTLYTGVTNSLDRRVFEHKHHLIRGFTAKYDCTRLVWFDEWADVRSAIARETQIKGMDACEEDCSDRGFESSLERSRTKLGITDRTPQRL